MAQGFDPSGSWSSMTDQFRRVFGDDFVQNLMKSINVSEMLGGNAGVAAPGSRMGDMGAAQGGSGPAAGAIPGMPGMPGIPGVPGIPNMQGFPFNMMGAAGGTPGGSPAPASSAPQSTQSGVVPRVDVIQTRHEVVVWMELPGAEAGDVKVSATPDGLRIKGNLRRPYTVSSDDQVAHAEMMRGEFTRDVPLPVRVKAEKIRANYRQGLLEVRMLKADPESGPRGQDIPIRFDA